MNNKILAAVIFLTAMAILAISVYISGQKSGDIYCIQVIIDARNPTTGEIRAFPTPCDVPEGWDTLETDHEFFEIGSETWTRYRNDDAGIRFEYRTEPDGYVRVETPASEISQENIVTHVSLLNKKEYAELLKSDIAREYPPAISVSIFDNPHDYSPRQWIESNSALSGIGMARSEMKDIQFSGVPAVRYTTDGLYLNDVIVALNNKRIYFISGSYLSDDSPIRKDFLEMLQKFSLY